MLRSLVLAFVVLGLRIADAQPISFAPVVLYDAGPSPQTVRLADMNGDGFPDMVVNNNTALSKGRVSVLLNHGDGTFASRLDYGIGAGALVAVGDLDGDGDVDVIAAGTAGYSFWYENDGTGVLTEHPLPGLVTSSTVAAIALLDYDEDGLPDLGVVTVWGAFEYSHNDGAGAFAPFVARELFPVDYLRNWPTALDTVDLDGDGRAEFVAASHARRSFIRLDWNGRRFDPTVMHNVGRVDSVAYGELDGLPGLDALITHGAPTDGSTSKGVWINCNDGHGALFTCERLRNILDISRPQVVTIGDFDRDGSNEIAVYDGLSLSVAIGSRDEFGAWRPVGISTTRTCRTARCFSTTIPSQS